jgi:hypothetical protein
MPEPTQEPITQSCSCQRCGGRCQVTRPGSPDAKMLRRSSNPKGLCVNCAVHDFLRNTYPCNMLLDESGAKVLLQPALRQSFAEIMRVANADAKPDEINWNLIVENWELPFPTKVKQSAMNPYRPGEDRPLGKGIPIASGKGSLFDDSNLVVRSFDELDAIEPGLGTELKAVLDKKLETADGITPKPEGAQPMGRKRKSVAGGEPLSQQTIPGTADEVPAEVKEAADAYVSAKRQVAQYRKKMNAALEDLINKMKENDVVEMLIEDGEKRLTLTEKDQIKIRARKKRKDGTGYEDNGDDAE